MSEKKRAPKQGRAARRGTVSRFRPSQASLWPSVPQLRKKAAESRGERPTKKESNTPLSTRCDRAVGTATAADRGKGASTMGSQSSRELPCARKHHRSTYSWPSQDRVSSSKPNPEFGSHRRMIGEKGPDQTDHSKKGQRKQEQKKSDKGDKERMQEQTKTSTPKDRKWRSWQWSTCCFMPLSSIGAALKVRDGEVKLMRGAKCNRAL